MPLDALWKQLEHRLYEGNINEYILTAGGRQCELVLLMPEVMGAVRDWISEHPSWIGPEAVRALKNFPAADLDRYGITPFLTDYHPACPEPVIGRMEVPVVTSTGMVRRVRVFRAQPEDGNGDENRRLQLDRVGAAVTAVIRKRSGRSVRWDPDTWGFTVDDAFERDDSGVEGTSMDLSLALALYSLWTGQPVPPDLSATAEVDRRGTVRPVKKEDIPLKLAALSTERHFIRRVLIAGNQETDESFVPMELIRVNTLEEAVCLAFPDLPEIREPRIGVDVDKEIKKMKTFYEGYLLDTCIDTATWLLEHLNQPECTVDKSVKIPAMFDCFWRIGSCFCHKGDVRRTEQFLKKARRLYERYSSGTSRLIGPDRDVGARISYAVALKDVFRYEDAVKLHEQIRQDINRLGLVDETRAKNESALSQVCVAMGRYDEAAELQNKAIRLMPAGQIYRNRSYLAQILMRSGNPSGAMRQLNRVKELIDVMDSGGYQKAVGFYCWFYAECLYRRAASCRRMHSRLSCLETLETVCREAGDISGGYCPALVHKFYGLTLLLCADEQKGMRVLNQVAGYFDTSPRPMFRLLGASVHAEAALHYLGSGRLSDAAPHIRAAAEAMNMQKDIRRYFHSDLRELTGYLRLRRPGHDRIRKAEAVLDSVRRRIPY